MDAQTKAPTWQLTARGAASPPPNTAQGARPRTLPSSPLSSGSSAPTGGRISGRFSTSSPPKMGARPPPAPLCAQLMAGKGSASRDGAGEGLQAAACQKNPPAAPPRCSAPASAAREGSKHLPPAAAAPLQPPKLQPRPRRTCAGHPARQHQHMELVQPLISCHR